jgi:phosphatidylglycerophosphate synthase
VILLPESVAIAGEGRNYRQTTQLILKTMTQPATSNLTRHIPNGITSIRIVIAAVFPFCPEPAHLPLVLAGLATEFLDGFVARLCNWTSYLGQVLDPIADKLFVLSISVTWIMLGKITLLQWLLFALRDFGVFFIFLILLAIGRLRTVRSVKARFPSKLTTAFQYLLFLVVLSGNSRFLMPLAILTAITGLIATLQYAYLIRLELKNL